MSDKSELKAELERKKQRLAQIREEKKRKEEERKKKEYPTVFFGLNICICVFCRRGPLKLGMSKVTQVDFPPRELVSYTKETQTPTQTHHKDDEEEEEDLALTQPALEHQEEKDSQKEEEEAPPHELTEEEKQQILHSEEFVTFFDHSSRIVERALSEQVDVFFDYSGRDLQDKEGESQAGAKLSLNRQFADERWSKHRVVTCLDWSPQYPELLAASYSSNEDAPHEPDGVALVWNMKYKKTTPEYVFHCQNNKPLYSFEDNSDYVYDVMWSPTHPALFACVDGVGHLDLWNLNNETEVPTASVMVEGNPALNRVRWAHSGREVAVGDSEGRVHIYDVGEQISVARQDEWTRFVLTLTEINENREDVEELAAQRLAA
ncbi:hypothetical protein cypCar_00036870 [Cyprinus carpio]|nr:hypothetical protein cypCar_00036870 [Cyprinus carpio]